MIQRLISIKNVGRFKNCCAAGDVTFRRYTLIFAENGRGKTTLCAILRSLMINTPAIILGRKTLGSNENPDIRLLTDTGALAFRDGAWSATLANVSVFDGTYVSENVFAGDVVDATHRRNLYRVIIGAQGVTLAQFLNDIDEQIKDKNAQIRENRAALQRYLPSGMTQESFLALPGDPQIETKIAAKEQELLSVQRADELKQRPELASVALPAFPPEFAQVLATTLTNVSADAERRVAEHILHHQMREHGEAWLAEGLNYVVADECPFCGRSLENVDILPLYRSFFDKEYHGLRDRVAALAGRVNSALGERVSAGIEQTILQNESRIEFWRQYCDLTAPVLTDTAGRASLIASLRGEALRLLEAKRTAPLDSVAPDAGFTKALADFEVLRTSLTAYNTTVAAANATIGARKRSTEYANAGGLRNAVAALTAQRTRHADENARDLCAAAERLQSEKSGLEAEKGRVRAQLDVHTAEVITRYGSSINRYLEKTNAGFRITTPSHTYRGGSPNTSYQIVINNSHVELGDSETPPNRPSFKNTLSAGDRSALALAFFLAQLELDPERTSKIVVLDDPFTSQDAFRRNHTIHQIVKCGEACEQVIVLSHEAGFLHQVWSRLDPATRKTLQLARVGEENTTIAEWDVELAVRARFQADIEALQRFFASAEGNRLDVVQKLRPVLEGYCRNVCPTQFGEEEMLGSMIGKVRAAGAAHSLSGIVEDLEEINTYSRRYHHADNPNAASEPIDDGELQGYVRRTLRLVGCLL